MEHREKVGNDINSGQVYALWNEAQRYPVGVLAVDDIKQHTLEIVNCERIILKDKSLEFQFELTNSKIEDFDEIIINGITFKRTYNDNI